MFRMSLRCVGRTLCVIGLTLAAQARDCGAAAIVSRIGPDSMEIPFEMPLSDEQVSGQGLRLPIASTDPAAELPTDTRALTPRAPAAKAAAARKPRDVATLLAAIHNKARGVSTPAEPQPPLPAPATTNPPAPADPHPPLQTPNTIARFGSASLFTMAFACAAVGLVGIRRAKFEGPLRLM